MKKVRAIFFCIIFTIIYEIVPYVSGAILAMFFLLRGAKENELSRIINNNFYILEIIAVCLFVIVVVAYKIASKCKISKDNERTNKNLKLNFVSIGLALAFSLLWCILTANEEFSNFALIKGGLNYYSKISPLLGYGLMILSVIIIAPIGEELLCRKIMIGRLKKDFSITLSIIISALIFGIIHLPAGGIVLGFGAFLMGLIFGFIYVSSGEKFTLVVMAHVIANCADFIFAILPKYTYIFVAALMVLYIVASVTYIYIKSKNLFH